MKTGNYCLLQEEEGSNCSMLKGREVTTACGNEDIKLLYIEREGRQYYLFREVLPVERSEGKYMYCLFRGREETIFC